jgi:hypothetical protein
MVAGSADQHGALVSALITTKATGIFRQNEAMAGRLEKPPCDVKIGGALPGPLLGDAFLRTYD